MVLSVAQSECVYRDRLADLMKDLEGTGKEAVVPQPRYSPRHLSAETDTFQRRQPVSRPILNVQQKSGKTKYKITYCSETRLARSQNITKG